MESEKERVWVRDEYDFVCVSGVSPYEREEGWKCVRLKKKGMYGEKR